MNDALIVLKVNLKNFNWETNTHYKIDVNEGNEILKALNELEEKENNEDGH